jgi:hypothetical protein
MTIKATSNQKDGSTICSHAILPFLNKEGGSTKLTKDNSVTLELLVNPATLTASAKAKTNVRKVSGTESPQKILHWVNDLTNQVFPGMGLTTCAAQRAALNAVTTGNTHITVTCSTHLQATCKRLERATMANTDVTHLDHVAVLAEALDTPDNLTTAMISVTMFDVVESMMPRHSLAKVQHYLRCSHCK